MEPTARCPHDVPGICPQCFPTESRTLGARKASLAIAWLERIERAASHEDTRTMAADALRHCRELIR